MTAFLPWSLYITNGRLYFNLKKKKKKTLLVQDQRLLAKRLYQYKRYIDFSLLLLSLAREQNGGEGPANFCCQSMAFYQTDGGLTGARQRNVKSHSFIPSDRMNPLCEQLICSRSLFLSAW